MKIDSSVIRRTPTHWMAKPTFESIKNRDLAWENELEKGKLLGGRPGTEAG